MITQDVLHTLAAIGVPQRLQAMEQELTAYYAEWPHLFHAPPTIAGLVNGHGPNGNSNGHGTPAAAAPPTPAEGLVTPKRRRKMSRKARAAISKAQKARWAKQKRANG
jgi:hypothetical protein